MRWYEKLSLFLKKSVDEIKAEFGGGAPAVKVVPASRHAAGRQKPRDWRAKRKAARKTSDASRKRNR